MPSTQELFGDDDSSSDEEVNNKSADDQQQQNNNKKTTTSNLDDSDEDDQGADFEVVGLKSTTLAGSKMQTNNNSRLSSTNDDDDDNANDAENDENERSRKPDIDTSITYSTEPGWSVPKFAAPALVSSDEESGSNNNSKTQLFMTKLPNFMGVQTQPFDPQTYDPEAEQDYFGPQSCWNLMRYRYKNGDQQQQESNTRLVQWEDGSYTLHIGTEAFTVDLFGNNKKGGATTAFPGLNGYLYTSQKAQNLASTSASAGTALECVGPIVHRCALQPTSLQSAAHKSLTVAVRQKTIQRAKIANYQTTQDPEMLKQERIRVKQDLDKAQQMKQGGGGGYRRPRRPRMSRGYMEDDDDDDDFDTTNIRAMKRRMYDEEEEEAPEQFGGDDEDDEDMFHRVRKKKNNNNKKSKRALEEEEDEEEEQFGDDDDDDVVPVVNKTNKKRPTQKSMFDDDDDSD